MTVIYRVETESGIGPYRDQDCWQESILANMIDSHADFSHPSPLFDRIGLPADDEHCGFDSLDRLIDWFGGWEHELESAGYFVMEYECAPEDYRAGNRQVVFTRHKAVKLAQHLPTDVLFDPSGA